MTFVFASTATPAISPGCGPWATTVFVNSRVTVDVPPSAMSTPPFAAASWNGKMGLVLSTLTVGPWEEPDAMAWLPNGTASTVTTAASTPSRLIAGLLMGRRGPFVVGPDGSRPGGRARILATGRIGRNPTTPTCTEGDGPVTQVRGV